jgi:hypothetical protein
VVIFSFRADFLRVQVSCCPNTDRLAALQLLARVLGMLNLVRAPVLARAGYFLRGLAPTPTSTLIESVRVRCRRVSDEQKGKMVCVYRDRVTTPTSRCDRWSNNQLDQTCCGPLFRGDGRPLDQTRTLRRINNHASAPGADLAKPRCSAIALRCLFRCHNGL